MTLLDTSYFAPFPKSFVILPSYTTVRQFLPERLLCYTDLTRVGNLIKTIDFVKLYLTCRKDKLSRNFKTYIQQRVHVIWRYPWSNEGGFCVETLTVQTEIDMKDRLSVLGFGVVTRTLPIRL